MFMCQSKHPSDVIDCTPGDEFYIHHCKLQVSVGFLVDMPTAYRDFIGSHKGHQPNWALTVSHSIFMLEPV